MARLGESGQGSLAVLLFGLLMAGAVLVGMMAGPLASLPFALEPVRGRLRQRPAVGPALAGGRPDPLGRSSALGGGGGGGPILGEPARRRARR